MKQRYYIQSWIRPEKITIFSNTILDKLTDLKYLKLGALNGDNNGISLLLDAGTLIAYFIIKRKRNKIIWNSYWKFVIFSGQVQLTVKVPRIERFDSRNLF